jgi:hypothetical protein
MQSFIQNNHSKNGVKNKWCKNGAKNYTSPITYIAARLISLAAFLFE